jgi:thymidylate synthase
MNTPNPTGCVDEFLCRGDTLPEAYHKALLCLKNAPSIPCPDWNTHQKEISMTMTVKNPLAEPMISRLFFGDPDSLEQYRQEMLDGILDFEIARGNWVYTYHSRYAPQYQFIVDELRRDPYSRRAVMDIRSPEDMGSEDPACWQHAQYFIRDGALHCKILFRSNDACKAAFMNAFALIMLQKKIADELGVPIGTYTHRANSFHCYERDYGMLDGYCSRIETADDIEDVTYPYDDEDDGMSWLPLMEDAKPAIAKKVAELKAKGAD